MPMLYPFTVALALWNSIVLLVGSIFTTPTMALTIGNAWLFLGFVLGIILGKAMKRHRIRQEKAVRYHSQFRRKPCLLYV